MIDHCVLCIVRKALDECLSMTGPVCVGRLNDRYKLERDRQLPYYDMSKHVHQFINDGLVFKSDFTAVETDELTVFKYVSLFPPSHSLSLCLSYSVFVSISARLSACSCFRCGSFSRLSHTIDLNIGTPVATLPGTSCCRISTGTGWPDVSILYLGEIESLICNFCLNAAVCAIIRADPSLRYTSMLLGC